jgi:protein-disulfide isomerase-like protein with CxxC motif
VSIAVTWFSDAGCPWAYSAAPALAALRWRYGDQLRWRLVMIGLTEGADQYRARGYTPTRGALSMLMFRRYGMPFSPGPKERIAATGRACRAVVATRLHDPANELAVHRALQFAWFTTPLVLDREADIATALGEIPGLDVPGVIAALDSEAVSAAYQADKDDTRSAAGGPTEFQGKAANSDGRVRFTAPSLVFERNGRRLEAGGFQPLEAYDVCIANLDPTLHREPPPASPLAALERFPDGLVTQEVAAIMAAGNDPPDRSACEAALIELAGAGRVSRVPLGDDALWLAAEVRPAGERTVERALATRA